MTSRSVVERTGGAGYGARPLGRELSALITEWPIEYQDDWAERSAILEHDARMGRDRAERAAEHIVRDRARRGLL